jgi:hypothetical protein
MTLTYAVAMTFDVCRGRNIDVRRGHNIEVHRHDRPPSRSSGSARAAANRLRGRS